MTISGDYPTPVQVNGFTCRNCTDVAYAKKHVDPAHPKDGPYGLAKAPDAKTDTPAVKFDGALSGASASSATDSRAPNPRSGPGAQLDVRV